MRFVGRQAELASLLALREKASASIVVLRGRRRIGKSRLTEELGKAFARAYYFSGLPPEQGVRAQHQRDEFARQLKDRIKGVQFADTSDWTPLFWALARATQKGSVLIVLDELTWMGAKDPTFLGKLKTAWDLEFKKNPQLMLVLSGSLSAWLEKNVLNSTGFLGRVSLDLHLDEMPLADCAQFWRARISPVEKLKVLSVTGGVPRYLEELLPALDAEQNIARMCFSPQGFLFSEFDRLFTDLFQAKARAYSRIVQALVIGPKTPEELTKSIKVASGGSISHSLSDLAETGYIARDHSWKIGEIPGGKLSRYRVADNYIRFYLKYIEPNKNRIETGAYPGPPSWATIFGLQVENLLIKNWSRLFATLALEPGDVMHAGPYFQKPTSRQPGCQIDYLIETRYKTLFACECKFTFDRVDTRVVAEMEQKLQRLKVPRGFSVRPILIHANGVSDAVVEREYFARIVDLTSFLETQPPGAR